MLYKARNSVIEFFDDQSSMISKNQNKAMISKHKATNGTGLRILTPKQMLQRLPIALAQVKAGNNSGNLLNEIRQLFILCINHKKIM